MPRLEIAELKFTYPEAENNDGYGIELVKLTLEQGQVKAITGVSGCGKSTLLECIACIRAGFSVTSFLLDDLDVVSLDKEDRFALRSLCLGYMPQNSALLPFLTLKDNLKLQLECAYKIARKTLKKSFRKELKAKAAAFLNRGQDRLMDQALDLLSALGMSSFLSYYPDALSAGQKQRAAFVKTICSLPEVLLIDEPTSALDPMHGELLVSSMLDIALQKQISVLMVTHDLDLVRRHGLESIVCSTVSGQKGVFSERRQCC